MLILRAGVLLIFLLFALPCYGQIIASPLPFFEAQNVTVHSLKQLLPALLPANVVYLGETHDSPQDHETQLKILQELQGHSSSIAVAMEMFQRPYQRVINNYLAGNISEQELLQQSQYEKRWGFPWKYYAPILEFASEKHLPVLALNTPTEVTRKVVQAGLESLTPSERQFIPPFSDIHTDNSEYRRIILDAFQQHQTVHHSSISNFERFFLAQVLWDETMADAIAKFLRIHPTYQVVVLAGQGHIIYGYGIPSRVARRFKDTKLVQRSVLLSPTEDIAPTTNKPAADFIWQPQPPAQGAETGGQVVAD